MPDFSVILQAPEVRALVQENVLERAFHDALFPRQLFRGEASPVAWPANVGDTMVFTGVGLIKPKMRPTAPGVDPLPSTFSYEQWTAQLNQYSDSVDTHMPTSITAIASLFYRNAQQLGMSSAQALNRITRNRMYNSALSGWTVAGGGATQSGTTLRVLRLNGFTRARRPDLAQGAPVKFDLVSANNPLQVTIFDNAAATANTVTGFTPDAPGDEVGPGTLTLGTAATSVLSRAYVISSDRTNIQRVGGGLKVDTLTTSNLITLADIRATVGQARQDNVPEMPDGRYHLHFDPTSESEIFADAEFQRLLTSMPDSYFYRDFAIGELMGIVAFRNTECPQVATVDGAVQALFSQDDPFAGELTANGAVGGTPVHRALFVGQGGVLEYYQDLAQLLTEVGVQGKIGTSTILNNGIEVNTDRIQLIIRAPQNRLQDQVSTSWKFIGDWPVRTDATSGSPARYKRITCIEHA